MAADKTTVAADANGASSALKKFSRMGHRRAGYITNTALSTLRELAANGSSEQVRLRASEILMGSEPVRERLAAMSDSSRRHTASRSAAATAELTTRLKELIEARAAEQTAQALAADGGQTRHSHLTSGPVL